MKLYDLTVTASDFDLLYNRIKNFEIIDSYQIPEIGDNLYIREYNNETKRYSGRYFLRQITYVLKAEILNSDTTYIVSLG